MERSDFVRGSSEGRGIPSMSFDVAIWWTVVNGVLVMLNSPRGPDAVGFALIMCEPWICALRGDTELIPCSYAIFSLFIGVNS